MTSKNRYIKWIESRIDQIEKHFLKFDEARKRNDIDLCRYYQTEIHDKFFLQIIEQKEKLGHIPEGLDNRITIITKQVYENKSISWD